MEEETTTAGTRSPDEPDATASELLDELEGTLGKSIELMEAISQEEKAGRLPAGTLVATLVGWQARLQAKVMR